MKFKNCTKCGEIKSVDRDHFYFRNGRFDSACKECTRAQQNKKYAETPEFRKKIKARQQTPQALEKKNRRGQARRANDAEWRNAQNARRQERYRNDPEYREGLSAPKRQRWANDTEYRQQTLSARKERYHNEPGYREEELSKRRDRYHSDPEHRQKILDNQRTPAARQRANQREKDRRANDLEWRETENAKQNHRYQNDPEYRQKILDSQKTPAARQRANQRNKKRRANDPEWRDEQNDKLSERYRTDPKYRERLKNQSLISRYGLTLAERDRMKLEQEGSCAICRQEKKLFIDHDHDTNQVRRLLCPGCNSGLGYFEENTGLMLSAVEYLNSPRLEPQDIPALPDEQIFARFDIPHWEAQSRDKKFRSQKNQNLRQQYGITIDQYEWLLSERNGVCWICLRPEERKRIQKAQYLDSLYVDHNHQSGIIRGLLCGKCNTGIGAFEDDPERIIKAAEYLEQWNIL